MFDLQDYASTYYDKYPTYGETNITTEYDSCEECNAVCYKLIDCDPLIATVMVDMDLSPYLQHTIRYVDSLGATHCALVESYICRTETWPVATITIVDCFDTCELCNTAVNPPTVITEFSIPNRSVAPGRSVPQCSTGSTCTSCGTTVSDSGTCGGCSSTGGETEFWLNLNY